MFCISFRIRNSKYDCPRGEKRDSRPMDGYTYPYKLGRETDPRYHPISAPVKQGTTLKRRITAPAGQGYAYPCGHLTVSAPRRNAAVTSPYRFQPPAGGRYFSVRLVFDGGEPHRSIAYGGVTRLNQPAITFTKFFLPLRSILPSPRSAGANVVLGSVIFSPSRVTPPCWMA